jgi:BMFP domain-containing protein YqiC
MTDDTDLIARLRLSQTGGIHYEAADALEAQARRIAELEEKLADEEYVSKDTNEMFHEVRDENIELRARIAELEAALKPFADASDIWIGPDEASIVGGPCTLGHLRAARAALEEKE